MRQSENPFRKQSCGFHPIPNVHLLLIFNSVLDPLFVSSCVLDLQSVKPFFRSQLSDALLPLIVLEQGFSLSTYELRNGTNIEKKIACVTI